MKNIICLLTASFLIFTPISPVLANCHEFVEDYLEDAKKVRASDDLLEVDYADIDSAWVKDGEDESAIELGVKTTENIPEDGEYDYNIFFFFDRDRDPENNEPSGTRAGSDLIVSLLYNHSVENWRAAVWEYDSEKEEWSGDIIEKEEDVSFEKKDTGFVISVSTELIPEGSDIPWRVAVAAAEENATIGDSIPNGNDSLVDCEYGGLAVVTNLPAPPDSEEPEKASEEDGKETDFSRYVAFGIIAVAAAIILMRFALDRRKKSKNIPDNPFQH